MKVEILMVLLFIAIVLLVFLLLREVVNWYYKINTRIDLMKRQNFLLENILTILKNKYGNSENQTTAKEDTSTNKDNET